MQTDNSYTPLRSDFDAVVKSHFNGKPISVDMRKTLEAVFFAGATSAYVAMTKTPEKVMVVYEELTDYACHASEAAH